MKKRFLSLFLLTFFLAGCTLPDPITVLPDIVTIQKDGHNIKSFDITGIPDEGIERGCWNEHDIHMIVTYDDDSTLDTPLKMKSIPREYRNIINTEGIHTFSVLFRGIEKDFTLKILHSDKTFTVNYYDYSGDLIQHNVVDPGGSVTPPDPLERAEDYRFIYTFEHWEYDLAGQDINEDYEVYPVYTPTMKRYHTLSALPMSEGYNYRIQSNHGNEEVYFHLGRIYHMTLANMSDTVHHVQAATGDPTELSFSLIWNYEAQMKVALSESLTYVDDSDTYQTKLGGDLAKLNPDNSIYFPSGDKPSEAFMGNTKTVLEGKEGEYEIFDTHYGPVANYYKKGDVAKGYIPANSLTGYYRLTLEADVDIVYAVEFNYNTTDIKTTLIFLYVDLDSAGYTMEYCENDSFASTKKIELKYSLLAKDLERVVGLEG